MRRWLVVVLAVLAALFLLPLVVPIPPVRGTVPPRALADADSQFVTLDGLDVHFKVTGQGDRLAERGEPALVLLHGFGASLFSWRDVMGPLGEVGLVAAFDRPAFGLTSRPMRGESVGRSPYSPEAAADLTVALMDALGVESAVLVGHSAGGAIALETALRHPERVRALVLVAPAVYDGGSPGWIRPLLRLPQVRRLGPLFVRRLLPRVGVQGVLSAWYDPDLVTEQVLEGYQKPLRAENWDKALWELTLASRRVDITRLPEITLPALIITGDSDTIVPPENSQRLAQDLPDAQLVVIPRCGHLPQEERPEAFVAAVRAFVAGLK
jgi:pimeloyl-ACP methyl ester carboxylesterase